MNFRPALSRLAAFLRSLLEADLQTGTLDELSAAVDETLRQRQKIAIDELDSHLVPTLDSAIACWDCRRITVPLQSPLQCSCGSWAVTDLAGWIRDQTTAVKPGRVVAMRRTR